MSAARKIYDQSLTVLQEAILDALGGRCCTTTEIARSVTARVGMSVTNNSVSTVLNALAKRGIVERRETIERVGSGITSGGVRMRRVHSWRIKREAA